MHKGLLAAFAEETLFSVFVSVLDYVTVIALGAIRSIMKMLIGGNDSEHKVYNSIQIGFT